MAKEETNKWTRERGFLELYGADLLMVVTSIFFLVLFVGAVAFVIVKPKVPGLSELFSDPKPPPRNPMDQKLNLAPGEQEIILFNPKSKTPVAPKPPAPPQKR